MADKSTDEAPKKKGKIGKILIFVLGGLSLVGVGHPQLSRPPAPAVDRFLAACAQ